MTDTPYLNRALEPHLQQALSQFPACLITGPRQAGKSTLLTHLLGNFSYTTLDDPRLRVLAQTDPALFLSRHKAPLIIDEIQYAPELLPYIKMQIDQNRERRGQYVLTGSQTFQVMEGISETLAGRIAIFHLYPFSWAEMKQQTALAAHITNDNEMAQQTVRGFYPEPALHPDFNFSTWYASYLATYVERDVRNIKAVGDLARFQMCISLLAARAGQLLNMSEIAKECGVTQPTIRSWLSILESTYIIHLLRPYHKNTTKRLVKMPKLYFVDTGLLCHLLGVDNVDRFFQASERGHIFENMVIMEVIKNLAYQQQRSACYFYRSASGVEVDLLVESQGQLKGYEIKLSKTPAKTMTAPLNKFLEEHVLNDAKILCLSESTLPLTESVDAVHWSYVIA